MEMPYLATVSACPAACNDSAMGMAASHLMIGSIEHLFGKWDARSFACNMPNGAMRKCFLKSDDLYRFFCDLFVYARAVRGAIDFLDPKNMVHMHASHWAKSGQVHQKHTQAMPTLLRT